MEGVFYGVRTQKSIAAVASYAFLYSFICGYYIVGISTCGVSTAGAAIGSALCGVA